MCRYATGNYKPHYACFACRKVFRRPLLRDIPGGGEDRPFKCPECAGEMANMGMDFAAPKQRDVKAWQVAASLYEIGETFHSCGCSGPGYRPRDPDALRRYVEGLHEKFVENAKTTPGNVVHEYVKDESGRWGWREQPAEEIRAYWNERVAAVRDLLARLPRPRG